MSLPSEYVIEDAVRSIDEVIVYRATHPIHGTVNVYLPDEALPARFSGEVKKRLYQSGLQMRDVSLLNIKLLAKALEVSQNPNEPYIVTEYSKHDLDELISNGVTLGPKRIYAIVSQVLQAIISLESNDWILEQLYARQIKLSDLHSGNASLIVFEGAEQRISVTRTTVTRTEDRIINTALPESTSTATIPQNRKNIPTATQTSPTSTVDHTATLKESDTIKQPRAQKKNIFLLGNIIYQLMFGRKYQSGGKAAEADIKTLSRRWKKVLTKSLNRDINGRYDNYEAMLRDVKKALNRNKRAAVASIPIWIVLAIIGGYFAYERYHQHKIMTSEAGQAIKQFLDIVNKTDDQIGELEKPQKTSELDDEEILKPFSKIKGIEED